MIEILHTIFVIMLYTLGILFIGFLCLLLYALMYNVYDKGVRPQAPEFPKDDRNE